MTYLVLIIGYLLGSVPFGLLLAKAMGHGDLRNIGSGNIGATNAMRTGSKKLGILTLLCDLLKGTLAVLIALFFAPEMAAEAGLAAVIGHVFPVWLKFKGGKGVATGLGVFLALNPWLALVSVAIWGGMFKAFRISSLAALSAFAFAPLVSFFLQSFDATIIVLIISLLIFFTHRSNISRLLSGEEFSFKQKKNNNDG